MNLVAADVRRLILFPAQEVRASLRRVLTNDVSEGSHWLNTKDQTCSCSRIQERACYFF